MRWLENDIIWMLICVLLFVCIAAVPFVKADEPVLEWDVAVIADTKAARGFQFFEQGDIIDYKPAGWEWGKEEQKLFSIFTIKATESQMAALVRPLEVTTGEKEVQTFDGKTVMEPVVERVKERRYGLAISTIDAKKALEVTTKDTALEAVGLTDKERK